MSASDVERVYGVMMDVGMIDYDHDVHWAMSLSAFASGEASFYPTPGGGWNGLGGDPQVSRVAEEIVEIAQSLWRETNPTDDFSLPKPTFVQFFFLTTSGVRVFKESLTQIQKPENPFSGLLNRFGFIRDFADRLSHDRASSS